MPETLAIPTLQVVQCNYYVKFCNKRSLFVKFYNPKCFYIRVRVNKVLSRNSKGEKNMTTEITQKQKQQLEKLAIKYKKLQAAEKAIKEKFKRALEKFDTDCIVTEKAEISESSYTSKTFNKKAFVQANGLDEYKKYVEETQVTRLTVKVVEE